MDLSLKIITITLCLFCNYSFSQNAEEIISKYIQNIGGVEKMNSIQGIKMKAKVDQMGMTIPLEIYSLKSGHTMTKVFFQGMEIAQGVYDGKTAWSTNFMTMKPEKMESEDFENTKRASDDFISPLLNHQQKGYTLELLGDETIEGVKCFKIKVNKKTSLVEGKEIPNVEYYYFDKESYALIAVESEMLSGPMKGQISQTLFSDYQEVSGIFFPFTITQSIKGQGGQAVVFESIEINPVVDLKMFSFPEEK